ncbi:MAG: hypothetical protein HQ592_17130 [Planctomycetes bacterium]|nr:hypothetical protein [Planctomycetota bacterium]
MAKQFLVIAVLLCVVVAVAGGARADVPRLISYQGNLTDASGPVSAAKTIVLGFYDADTGGNLLQGFTETHTVTVKDGIFNVLIGSATPGGVPPIIFDGPPGAAVYLSINVEGQELLPRRQVVSVAYALRSEMAMQSKHTGEAENALLLDGLDSLQFLRSDEDDTTTGTLTAQTGLEGQGKDGSGFLGGADPIAGVKGVGTDGAGVGIGAPGIVAVGGGGTMLGELDLAFRSYGELQLLTHDDEGVELEPGNGQQGHQLAVSGYGGTTQSSVYSLVHFDGNIAFDPGSGVRLKPGTTQVTTAMWKIHGDNTGGSKQLLIDGPGGQIEIDGGIIVTENTSGGIEAAAVYAENVDREGIAVTARVSSSDACGVFINGGSGDILRGFNGDPDADLVFRVYNSGRVRCTELQITAGSDLAEPFDVTGAEEIKPGMVVAIDPHNVGKLRLATKAYDRTVAGIVSGANGIRPGVTMQQEGTPAAGELPVALTGRVYCWCDASDGPIQPGDMLTTSDTPGHAMKVADYARAQGAILGKAMSALPSGRGLVLVLVRPQ